MRKCQAALVAAFFAALSLWALMGSPPAVAQEKACYVAPKQAMEQPVVTGDLLLHMLVDMVFAGEPEDSPQVNVVYSNAPPAIEEAVRKHLSEYRFTCRKRSDPPRHAEQMFTFKPPNRGPIEQVHGKSVDIATFISYMKFEAEEATVLDFDGMQCPFRLGYMFLDQRKLVDSQVGTPADVTRRRLPLIQWLYRHDVNYASAHVANDLVGQRVELRVPCGQLKVEDLRRNLRPLTLPP